jgi:hypothetical protein
VSAYGTPLLHFEPLKLLNTDADPAFPSNAEPDPAFHSTVDPDPHTIVSVSYTASGML